MGKFMCQKCETAKASLKRPKNGMAMCKECFYEAFEQETHETIIRENLFKRGDKVAIGASGGKDSTVLAFLMKTLNDRHDYGLDLFLLSVDEGIAGYRDDSLETVKRNKEQYGLPLVIVSFKDLYGWTMDDVVAAVGRKSNCTVCGVFRRQALDRGAVLSGADKIVTGHNADDVAETVLMNVLRGDGPRLARSQNVITGADGVMPRSKPLAKAYEKEIVLYAYYRNLDYFSTECTYSPTAFRGHARTFIKDAEAIRPSSILDIIHAASTMVTAPTNKWPVRGSCSRCGYISSGSLCQACRLLDGLNSAEPSIAVATGKASRKDQMAASKATMLERRAVLEGQPPSTTAPPPPSSSSSTATVPPSSAN